MKGTMQKKKVTVRVEIWYIPAISWIHPTINLIDVATGKPWDSWRGSCPSGFYHNVASLSVKEGTAVDYLLAGDKKDYRRRNLEYEGYLYDGRITEEILRKAVYILSPSNYDVKIAEIVVMRPFYICPRTGVIWTNHNEERSGPNDRAWFFRYYRNGSGEVVLGGMCLAHLHPRTKRGTRQKICARRNKRAFGRLADMLWPRALHDAIEKGKQDPRAFMDRQVRTSRTIFSKCIARHLKKLSKIRAITKGERKVFQAFLGVKMLAKYAQETPTQTPQ